MSRTVLQNIKAQLSLVFLLWRVFLSLVHHPPKNFGFFLFFSLVYAFIWQILKVSHQCNVSVLKLKLSCSGHGQVICWIVYIIQNWSKYRCAGTHVHKTHVRANRNTIAVKILKIGLVKNFNLPTVVYCQSWPMLECLSAILYPWLDKYPSKVWISSRYN